MGLIATIIAGAIPAILTIIMINKAPDMEDIQEEKDRIFKPKEEKK